MYVAGSQPGLPYQGPRPLQSPPASGENLTLGTQGEFRQRVGSSRCRSRSEPAGSAKSRHSASSSRAGLSHNGSSRSVTDVGECALKRFTAQLVLSLDPAADLDRAQLVHDAHLARARWMTRVGHRLLPEVSRDSLDAQASHYDRRSERAFTSSLRCRTISIVLRMSASLRATTMVDAIERSRALSSR
jgi:hypothetical protein